MKFLQDLVFLLSCSFEGKAKALWRLIKALRFGAGHLKVSADVIRSIPQSTRQLFFEKFSEKSHGTHAGKYFDLIPNVLRMSREAHFLGLIGGPAGRKILDLGTGFGYFPLVCKSLGLEVDAIDKDEKPIYEFARGKLMIDVLTWTIRYDAPVPSSAQRYDLISAIAPVFYLYSDDGSSFGSPWSDEKWEVFFKKISQALTSGGRLYIGDNRIPDESGRERMFNYFARRGGKRYASGWLFDKSALRMGLVYRR